MKLTPRFRSECKNMYGGERARSFKVLFPVLTWTKLFLEH